MSREIITYQVWQIEPRDWSHRFGVINHRFRSKKSVVYQKFKSYNNLTGESSSFFIFSRDVARKMNIFAAREDSQELGGSCVWRNW